jgi:gamma-glutamylcyclotransferase (GGCT)/AIG2-like uncharacterized protein YtfP
VYYFAYGSNMDSSWLWGRVERGKGEDYAQAARKAANPQRAIVRGYRLSFSKPADRNPTREGYADIHPDPTAKVEGVVYAVPEQVLDILDVCEGTASGHYKRIGLAVVLPLSTSQVRSVTYKGLKQAEGLRPSAEYMQHLINGAIEHHLDAAWVDMLRSVETLKPQGARHVTRRKQNT